VSTVEGGRESTGSKKRWSLIIEKKLEQEKAERLLEEPERKYFKKMRLYIFTFWSIG
jgi:hypothetical protein